MVLNTIFTILDRMIARRPMMNYSNLRPGKLLSNLARTESLVNSDQYFKITYYTKTVVDSSFHVK